MKSLFANRCFINTDFTQQLIFHNKQVVDQDLVYNGLKYEDVWCNEDVKHNNTCIWRNLFNTISQECIWVFRKKNQRICLKLII